MARATKLRVVGGKTTAYVTPRPVKHGLPVGAPCPNCGTTLAGPWCYACGQKGAEYHRSIIHLIAEALEGVTHFDGRFWRTLPRLIAQPGALTRDYLDGKRASQIPPFRMFLVVLLLLFFAGGLQIKMPRDLELQLRKPDAGAGDQQSRDAYRNMSNTAEGRWLVERLETVRQDPEALVRSMEHWSHQFAVLMLPIAALLLSLLFVFKKGIYVFDHLIFSMHSLSFQGLLLSGVFMGSLVSGWASALLLLAPVHLFFHMRQTYRIGVFGTLIRMALLAFGSVLGFGLLMAALVFVGLATVH